MLGDTAIPDIYLSFFGLVVQPIIFAICECKSFLQKTSTKVLAAMLIANYYMLDKIGIAVSMSSTGMLEKKRIHHDLVAGDVERFLAEGGQITKVASRTSQQAECDYAFTGDKKWKYNARIKREKARSGKRRRMTFKTL